MNKRVWLVHTNQVGYGDILREVFSSYEGAKRYCDEKKRVNKDAVWEQGALYLPSGEYYTIEFRDVRE